MQARTRTGVVLVAIPLVFLLACGGVTANEPAAKEPPTVAAAAGDAPKSDTLPDAPGKEATLNGCLAGCHQVGIFDQNYTAQEWQQCVDDMIGLGAPITEEDYYPIVLYLAKNLARDKDAT